MTLPLLRNTNNRKAPATLPGFTIVELLIVIVVIAILAAISIVAYNGVQDRARASAAQSAARQASNQLMAFHVQNDRYPTDTERATLGITNTDSTDYQYRVNNTANPPTYCLTVTVGNQSYYVSSTQASPTEGGCLGDTIGGGTEISSVVISNFDDVNPSYSHAVGTPTIASAGGFSGNGVRYTDNVAHKALWFTGTPLTRENFSTYLSGLVRLDSGSTPLAGLILSTGSGTQGYQFLVDARNATGGGSASLQIRRDAGTAPLAVYGQSGLIETGVWYRVEVEWRATSPNLTARFYNHQTNTLIHTLTANDSAYTGTLYPGFHAHHNVSLDELRYQ